MMERVRIFDTTLRDGEQSPGFSMNQEEKLQLARQLARLQVDVIEAGFPIASPGDFEGVRAVAREVRGPVIAALARTHPADVEAAARALEPAERARIHTFIATSPIHMRHKLRKEPDEVVEMAVKAVAQARRYVDDVEFSAEDATRSDWDFLVRVFSAALGAGATTLNVPDTVGYTTPEEYAALIQHLREEIPGCDRAVLSVHTHDDLGLAVANALAAVQAGARQVEGTINGIGERAGNCSLEEVVMALRTRHDRMPYDTGVETTQIYPTSRLLVALTGVEVQPNKAIVGANAFAHEAGIHQDGVLKERSTYEIMTPQSIGLARNRLVLGKHSGRHAVRARLDELGFHLAQEELERVYQRFLEVADRKKVVTDGDLAALAGDEAHPAQEQVQLVHFQVSTGTGVEPMASVRLQRGEEVLRAAASGDGPVDALYRAMDQVLGLGVELAHYQLQATGEGRDALGQVTVRLRRRSPEEARGQQAGNGGTSNGAHLGAGTDLADSEPAGREYVGHGSSTDILEASARAYLQAVNKLLADQASAASTVQAASEAV
ncbi:2-isopropylmalate synthase [Limnochorda pilosa]